MGLLYPTVSCGRVTELTVGHLRRWGVEGLILDVDNTLATHDNPVPAQDVARWLDELRAAGIKMIILSNNRPSRVAPFAKLLGLDFAADGKKPLTGGFHRAAAALGLERDKLAVVGDQIFTDVLGGNLFGAKTVLVKPIEPEKTRFFRLKRRLEGAVLQSYAKRRRETTL